MSVQALVFDFGNVVGFFSHRRATERLAPHSDLDADVLHSRLFGGPLEEESESGRLLPEPFIRAALDAGRLRCTPDFFLDAYTDIFWPNPEVCSLVPALARRHPLFLLSNTNELHARKFLAQFERELKPFRELILSYQVGDRKPRCGIFAHARKLAGCAPEEMLFIDDVEANVEGARACGWKGIVYRGTDELLREMREQGIDV